MDFDKMMRKIAIEEAPRDLVKRWKIELSMRQTAAQRNWNWLYIVAPLLLAGIFFGLYFFNIRIPWRIETSDFAQFFNAIHFVLSSYESFVISSHFLIGSIIFSVIVASLSLIWYYIRYSEIKF